MAGYRDGTDLIAGFMQGTTPAFVPFGHSTGCKISDSTETGSRKTKEATSGKWEEKYVKKLGETVQVDGFEYDGDANNLPSLKKLWLDAKPVMLRYAYRGAETSTYYEVDYLITALEQAGQAGDDTKYSVTFELSGALTAQPALG